MVIEVPDWAKGINDAIHAFPAQPGGGESADLVVRITAAVRFSFDSFIGQIAVAFGGIEIFGWKPLEFLADWGQERIDEAAAAYLAAVGAQETADSAQESADVANSQIALLTAAGQNVRSGGNSITETFDGTDDDKLSDLPNWYQRNIGATSGTYGRQDGLGHWYPSGGSDQTIISVRTDEVLNFSRQQMRVLLKKKIGSGDRGVRMPLRCNADGSDYVFVEMQQTTVRLGYSIADVDTWLTSTVGYSDRGDGEVWEFTIGSAALGDWHWVIRRVGKGAPLIDGVLDPSQPTLLDTDHRCPAIINFANGTGFGQSPPPDIDVITWIDPA